MVVAGDGTPVSLDVDPASLRGPEARRLGGHIANLIMTARQQADALRTRLEGDFHPIVRIRNQVANWTTTTLTIIVGLSAAGCDSASTARPKHSIASATTATPSASPPGSPPATARALPDPCELARPAKIRWLRRLADAKPTRDSDALLNKCTWEVDNGGLGATRLRVAVADHPAGQSTDGGKPSFVVTNCTGTSKSSSRGDFCLDRDERGMEILHRNLYVTVIWADTGVNRTQPESAQHDKVNQINKQLEEQVYAGLPA